jgi:sulfide:quinone oxidoreductase
VVSRTIARRAADGDRAREAHDGAMTGPSPLHVVVAGGGIAGLETLLALHELADERVAMTLVEPRSEVVLHALELAEPFSAGEAGRLAVDEVAAIAGADVVRSAVEAVDPNRRTVAAADGQRIGYDALVVALGARPVVAVPRALTWLPGGAHAEFRDLLDAVERGSVTSVAFVVPPRCAWPLPAYELALMTRRRVERFELRPTIRLVTPEPMPLAMFGAVGSAAVARELEAAGVRFSGNAIAAVRGDEELVVDVWPSRQQFAVDRVVALPRACGPSLPGIPADIEGFVVTDEHCRVHGTPGVWAAGDVTDRRPMTGGLAALQADCVAQEIAALAGVPVPTAWYTPILRAQLRTGRASLWLQRDISDALDHGAAAREPLWSPRGKIAARRLGTLLGEREEPAGLRVARPPAPAPA